MSPFQTNAESGWGVRDGFYQVGRLAERGFPHGVTTRGWGDMSQPDSRVDALRRACNVEKPVRLLRQVHGADVVAAQEYPAPPQADGWIAQRFSMEASAGRSIFAVFIADCLPVYFWEEEEFKVFGLAHLGWRGIVRGMTEVMSQAFELRFKVPASKLHAAIGPHIHDCCYRVGAEVAGQFDSACVRQIGGNSYLDLSEEVSRRLRRLGVPGRQIHLCSRCTFCGQDEFFSYRRDGQSRHMMAFMDPYG
ncbi:MAG: hypothetical protein A3G41_02715 [Elusimicrobia bacterium RIFCSPLOWO2_12_FULL_59_9]|nr:MAG: hypothetical protein A3G41_02715 [Elusimicrobia bacterium RIFCSPLOWO2_12_FULL_59_9]